jgi:hypothetical protein
MDESGDGWVFRRGEQFARFMAAAMKPRPCDGCDLDGPPGTHFPPEGVTVFGDGTCMVIGDERQLRAAAAWMERHK